jgi:hypothetical protein
MTWPRMTSFVPITLQASVTMEVGTKNHAHTGVRLDIGEFRCALLSWGSITPQRRKEALAVRS